MKPKAIDPAHLVLLVTWAIALAVSAYHAYDPFTWVLEVFPAVIGIVVVVFPLALLHYRSAFAGSASHGGEAPRKRRARR